MHAPLQLLGGRCREALGTPKLTPPHLWPPNFETSLTLTSLCLCCKADRSPSALCCSASVSSAWPSQRLSSARLCARAACCSCSVWKGDRGQSAPALHLCSTLLKGKVRLQLEQPLEGRMQHRKLCGSPGAPRPAAGATSRPSRWLLCHHSRSLSEEPVELQGGAALLSQESSATSFCAFPIPPYKH